MYSPFQRIILGIILIAFIAWRLKKRWSAASDYVEGELEEKRAWKKGFENFKENPDYKFTIAHIEKEHATTYEEPMDDTTFQVIFGGLFDEKMQYLGLENPDAKYLIVALKNKNKKISYVLNITTREIGDYSKYADSIIPSGIKS